MVAQRTDRVEANLLQDEITALDIQISDISLRIDQFVLKAPFAGEFALPRAGDILGRWYQRGDVIAQVADPSHYTILGAVPQMSIDRLREDNQSIRVRPVDHIQTEMSAKIARAVPAATKRLPSMALALQGGGTLGIEPGSEDPIALDPVFLIELAVKESQPISQFLGERVYIRFEHSPEPLVKQWYRLVRDLFIRKFGV